MADVDYTNALATVKKQVVPTINGLAIPAQKVLALVLAKVNPSAPNLGDLRFRIQAEDYATLANIKSPKTAWRQLQTACDALESSKIRVSGDDILELIPRKGESLLKRRKPSQRNMGIVDHADYYPYDQTVEIMFTRAFEPYIVQVSKMTPYHKDRVQTTLAISNEHTMKIYRKLADFGGNKRKSEFFWKLSLETFKAELGIEGLYDDFRNLRRRIIEPALKTLNAISEYQNITCQTEKTGRKVTGLVFKYERRQQQNLPLGD